MEQVGNQLPILLISFPRSNPSAQAGWESVTNPLDKLCMPVTEYMTKLGISYQSS